MFVQSARSCLRVLITPLSKEALVCQRLLDDNTVDLDEGLVEPSFIFALANSARELTQIKPGSSRLLYLRVYLVLLVF